jgi:hypothetical protein
MLLQTHIIALESIKSVAGFRNKPTRTSPAYRTLLISDKEKNVVI